jgi:hypothetical protein
LVLVGSGGSADAVTATLVSESFTSTTTASPSWALPIPAADVANQACLSAAGSDPSQPPVPRCAAGVAGTQAGLQLTDNGQAREGGVAYSSSVPSTLGLDVTFTSYQYGTTTPDSGADGIAFFLAASDPNNAGASPITLGPVGGNLGYVASGTTPGLTHGYLGVGLDVYGNFSNVSGAGCATPAAFLPQQVTVRGPGDGTSGYCQLDTAPMSGGATLDTAGAPVGVPVEVAVNPTTGEQQSVGGLPRFSVPAGSYVVRVQPVGSTTALTLTKALPDASAYVPAGWTDASGVPQQLSFGWSAASGSSTDFHTISDVVVQTLNGTPPALGVNLTSNGGAPAHNGQVVTYSAAASVNNAAESRPITLTDTFPPGLTPQPASGTGWDCSTSLGQTITCTHAAAGTGALPTVSMPVLVGVPAGPAVSLSDTVVVGSPDATQGSSTLVGSFTAAPAATVLAFPTQPVNAKVNTAMPSSVKVSALVAAGGAVDTAYTGSVTLAFAANPGGASFVVGGVPVSSLSAAAVNGVATFTPTVNAVGFGYTLTATASGLTSVTSTAFDVNAETTTCAATGTCTVTTTSTTGVGALVQGQPGATITATFGGNVVPIRPCTGSTQGILTFSGNGLKLITLTYAVTKAKPIPVWFVCYGQPTPFLDVTYRKTTYFSAANQEYEGILPVCLPQLPGPCVKSVTFTKTTEKIVIQSATGDPRVMG